MADRLNFIRARIVEDQQSATPTPLAEYVVLFPGEDVLVARAYADLHDNTDAGSAASSDQDRIGHYKLLKELGRGGQGVVYLAEDTRLHRKVALKVLTGLGPGSEDSVHRLRREAEVASRLEHPGICGVHDAGVANGVPYIAMHYVDGKTLAERTAEAKSRTTNDPTTTKKEIPDILRVFEKAAVALHAAHEAGIIHRDIKPGNIVVTSSGQPVLLDFGLARADDLELQTLTRTGDVFGTPAYMSPEQISGQRIRLDRRSDVYSLGVTLYECLTLRRPFEAPTREGVYQAVMTKSPPDPRKINPAISKDLKVVIEAALEKDRDRRYATAEAMAKDLQAVLEGRPIQARPVGPVGRFVRWSKREPAKASLLGVLLVALPVIAVLVTSHIKDQPQIEAAHLAKIEQTKDAILSDASYEISEGDPKKAIELCNQVLEMEGISPEAAGGLVLAQLKLKNYTAALQLLDVHRGLLGDGAAAHVLRADALSELGRKDEAEALMKTAPAPRSAFEHQLLAQKALQNCQTTIDQPAFERALRHATTAVLLSPAPRLSLYTLRAHAAGHAKDRDAEVETASALRKRWPDSGSALFWCGYALFETGDPAVLDEAIAAWREAIRLMPDTSLILILPNLGKALEMKGLHDEAIAAYREAIRRKPDLPGAYVSLGSALEKKGMSDEAVAAYRDAIRVGLGKALGMKGLYDEALADREALQLKPDLVGAYINLGNVLDKRGLYDEAIAAYREAIRLSPRHAPNYSSLGCALGHKGLIEDAIAAFRDAIRLKPDLAEAHRNLAVLLETKGLLDDAVASYREAIRFGPDHAETHSYFAILLGSMGRDDDSMAACREAIRLDPDCAEAYTTLGNELSKKGLIDDSIAACREAIRLAPDNAAFVYSLGNALGNGGLLDDAIAAYREAIRLNPDYAEAHCNLGHRLGIRGEARECLAELRRGHELGSRRPGWPYPSEQWVAQAQQRVDDEAEFEAQIAGHVAAGTRPESASELVALARVALEQNRPALAARWFQAAFEESPEFAETIEAGHWRRAARAAVLASVGGTDSAPALDALARTAWRAQALAWLETALAATRKAFEAKRLPPEEVRFALVPLTRSPDFASVRGPDALAKLPEAERPRWTKLWADIDALLSPLVRKPESRAPETRR